MRTITTTTGVAITLDGDPRRHGSAVREVTASRARANVRRHGEGNPPFIGQMDEASGAPTCRVCFEHGDKNDKLESTAKADKEMCGATGKVPGCRAPRCLVPCWCQGARCRAGCQGAWCRAGCHSDWRERSAALRGATHWLHTSGPGNAPGTAPSTQHAAQHQAPSTRHGTRHPAPWHQALVDVPELPLNPVSVFVALAPSSCFAMDGSCAAAPIRAPRAGRCAHLLASRCLERRDHPQLREDLNAGGSSSAATAR
jgi:hypothetical protein